MRFYIVIPAHNEEAYIQKTLTSVVTQTLLPKKIVVVNDNSTDKTEAIIDDFCQNYSFIEKVSVISDDAHLPGSKVINAFYKGFETLDKDFDVIVKLDADIILPKNYFEKLQQVFSQDPKVGIAGGLAYIEHNGEWIYETVADKNHVRGPFKAYRKACFEEIGGLKRSLGWDTADVLLARYHGWKVATNHSLKVKHLKPTGNVYREQVHEKHGEVFYKLGYDYLIAFISAAKIGWRKKSFRIFNSYMKGFNKAKRNHIPKMVSEAEAAFIRKFRITQMKRKIARILSLKR